MPPFWADPHQLHQVLVNLIANAYHAMRQSPPPRRLTLTTTVEPDLPRARLTVADTGPGIPPEIQQRIFEPFFTTKPVGQGTGLGLSLCSGIVEEHGGTIAVESVVGQGTTFVVELPMVAVGPEASPRGETRQDPPRVGGRRLLVVDDEAAVAAVLAEVLRGEGHEVDTAGNGAEALDRLAGARPYDLILSDTKMPVLDGPGFFQELERRHPEMRQRVVFVTGDVLNPDKREFLERTGAPTITKPFNLDDVRRVVRGILA
jgi:two-component system NtrC family sensor kinase